LNENRSIRVFLSSTFRDMVDERDALMAQTWPELRRFCRERQVELVEVDLRWGIAEDQSTRRETLKLCLDEIHSCRPFFIGLLGERYGWVPDSHAYSDDLCEEQPWLRGLAGKSVTELEILHGVLNNPERAGRSFFYFRDPTYAQAHGSDFLSEDTDAANKLAILKETIRRVSAQTQLPLYENYPNPQALAAQVLKDLKVAFEAEFPVDEVLDAFTLDAQGHEALAKTRRRVYIARPDYFAQLDRHAMGDGGPLVVFGDSGSGKSALMANWLEHWKSQHPEDFIFQHYIGSTPDSADHWRLMARLVVQIKLWTNNQEESFYTPDDLLHDFPIWLTEALIQCERDGRRCIIVLDALDQLDDRDHARLLGWLPTHPFRGMLRLIVSVKPGEMMQTVEEREWESLRVEPLLPAERRRIIENYLARFGKRLNATRLDRLTSTQATANPLYLKILLDEMRVTGTHDLLDERINEYLSAPDIPALLEKVLQRYQDSYEHGHPGLVGETLGLIWAARRGLTEAEILHLLKPEDLPQLPLAIWSPLRAGLEESLVDRGGILNFAHDFLRSAVEKAFITDESRRKKLRLELADYFEDQPTTARSCDELPWLLQQTKQNDRLRACLLDIDSFLLIYARNREELVRYWVDMREEREMGGDYLASIEDFLSQPGLEHSRIFLALNNLAHFLDKASLFIEGEAVTRYALRVEELFQGPDHPAVASCLNSLAGILLKTNRWAEAEPLVRRALEIDERSYGPHDSIVAIRLNNLAELLRTTNRLGEAEPLFRRAIEIDERNLGPDHPNLAIRLNNLGLLLEDTNRLAEAESLLLRALTINENAYGPDHPEFGDTLGNLAGVLSTIGRFAEAEDLLRFALKTAMGNYGPDHPSVASKLTNLGRLLRDLNRLTEAEPLFRLALAINENAYGSDHPDFATSLSNLGGLLSKKNQYTEAEPLYRQALEIKVQSFGPDHSAVAIALNNLAELLRATNRLAEAEPMYHLAIDIDERSLGSDSPVLAVHLNNLGLVLQETNRQAEAVPLCRRALEINENCYGPHHPYVAKSLNSLAYALDNNNRLTESEPLYRRAIAINEKNYGPDHPEVGSNLNNLAWLLQTTNRLAEAEPLMRRALAIGEKSLGANHLDVARYLANLAGLLDETDRLVEAEVLYRRALRIREERLGLDHPDVAISLNNLAKLLQLTGRFAEAEPFMRRNVEIFLNFTRATQRPHRYLQAAVNNYVRLLREMGQDERQINSILREMAPEFFPLP
jgi:nephrocystin-3